MATAAELKARLAKYAVKQEQQNEQVQRTELPDNGSGRGQTVVPESAATVGSGSSASAGTVPENVPARELPLQHGTLSTVVLSDQLQSTEVVVVEREIGPQVREERTEETVTDLDTSNPVHQNFLQRLADLETALLARDPLMKTHLGEIHKHMIQYEEIANLLRPEEIAKIMAAQQQHTGIVLRAEAVGRSKAATTKKAAKLGVDDL